MASKRSRTASLRKTAEQAATTAKEMVKPHGFEFGGPIGATILTVSLPPLVYLFAFVCNDVTGCPAPSLRSPIQLFSNTSTQTGWEHGTTVLKQEVGWPGWAGLISIEGMVGTLAWYALSLALWAVLPAYELEGVELSVGGRQKYRMNCLEIEPCKLELLANRDNSFLLGSHHHDRLCSRYLGLGS